MNNCSSCGATRKDSDKFCLNCGSKFESIQKTKPIVSSIDPIIPTKNRKKRVIGLVSIGLVFAALFAAHFILQAKYDSSKKIIEMNQAFAKGDSAEFFSYFSVDDDIVSDEKGFYSFVESEGWEEIRNQLQSESKLVENGGLADIILDSEGNNFLSVVNEPKFFGLYDNISFLVHPVIVEAAMPFDKTSLTLGNSTVTGNQGDNKAVGKFLPGNYEWQASAPSTYSSIKNKDTVTVQGDGENLYSITPDLAAGTLNITSDVDNAVLWINGKSTKKTVGEMNAIGPVPFDGSIEILAETTDENGKKVKSETVSVEGDAVHLTFPHVQEKAVKELAQRKEAEELKGLAESHDYNVKDFISFFRYEFESALNYGDYDYLSSFFPMGSSIESEYMEKMVEHASSSEFYEYEFLTTEVTDIEALDQETLLVHTEEEFLYTLSDKLYRYYKTKAYTLTIKGNGYLITNIKELTNVKREI